jgi:hypothetical protein
MITEKMYAHPDSCRSESFSKCTYTDHSITTASTPMCASTVVDLVSNKIRCGEGICMRDLDYP